MTLQPSTHHPKQPSAPARLDYGDPMRVLAIVAVVCIHVTSPLVNGFGVEPMGEWWAGATINALVRWCVPLFVMLSGALLLDPVRQEGVGDFFRKRAIRVGLPLLVWSAFYLLWFPWWRGVPVDFRGVIYQVMLGKPAYHMPFLFAIAGLYVVTPVLRRFVMSASVREREYLIAVAMLISVLAAVFGALRSPMPPTLAVVKFLPYLGFFCWAMSYGPGWMEGGVPVGIGRVLPSVLG